MARATDSGMLRNAADLKGLVIHATDGELGAVEDIYFDDETWSVRYFTVNTGSWLSGRVVLISPLFITHTDWQEKRLDVALTQQQVERSPDINTHQPVSRQHETEYFGYYGHPVYWGGPYLWGSAPETEPADSHLRSAESVTGYNIEASDGEIGHVAGFVVQDQTWAIRYIEVSTRNWWPGKKVLISPAWIERVSWMDASVDVKLSRDAIQSGPEYVESEPITREYESQLFTHYGRPPYWSQGAGHAGK